MSIKTDSPVSWKRVFLAGDHYDVHDITATAEGLEIDYDTLEWSEIDAARTELGMETAAKVLAAALLLVEMHAGDGDQCGTLARSVLDRAKRIGVEPFVWPEESDKE